MILWFHFIVQFVWCTFRWNCGSIAKRKWGVLLTASWRYLWGPKNKNFEGKTCGRSDIFLFTLMSIVSCIAILALFWLLTISENTHFHKHGKHSNSKHTQRQHKLKHKHTKLKLYKKNHITRKQNCKHTQTKQSSNST